MMILKSYGFEENLSKELLIKHNGHLFKVLSEYYSIMKPKYVEIEKIGSFIDFK